MPLTSTIWSSADGIAWQQVRSVDSPVYATSFGPLGVVMATSTTMLQSADEGATWSEAPLPPEFDGAAVTLLGQTPDGRLLVGTVVAAERRLAIWVGTPTQ